MTIELAPLGTLTFEMETSVLRGGPVGTRVIVGFRNCELRGERITATQRGATAGDWLVVGPEGTATLDIRILLETADGALVYLHGAGRTDANEFPRGGALWLTPIFEAADPRYAWLNKIQAIAKGRAEGAKAVFELFEAR
jgi:hypothetical protein